MTKLVNTIGTFPGMTLMAVWLFATTTAYFIG